MLFVVGVFLSNLRGIGPGGAVCVGVAFLAFSWIFGALIWKISHWPRLVIGALFRVLRSLVICVLLFSCAPSPAQQAGCLVC